MLWDETSGDKKFQVADRVVDLSFSIVCKQIAADHMQPLYTAVLDHLPWIADTPGIFIHPLHVAESGNGWMRPHDEGAVLHPSKRTRLLLRVPETHKQQVLELSGKTLSVDDAIVEVGLAKTKSLVPLATIFCRHLIADPAQGESEFIAGIAARLKRDGIHLTKALCGISSPIRLIDGTVHTRRLLLADLSGEDSITIQENGLGEKRAMGFGLFIPHRGITEVTKDLD